jgi:hypothetical protein
LSSAKAPEPAPASAKRFSGHGHVLEELDRLHAVAENKVKDDGGDHAEDGERQRRVAGPQPEQDTETCQ